MIEVLTIFAAIASINRFMCCRFVMERVPLRRICRLEQMVLG